MTDIKQKLQEQAKAMGIKVTAKQAESFQAYMELLLSWNEKINLTAITQPEEISEKHFIDSLTLLQAGTIKENAKLIDVGTGAGFPGIPLKLMRPDLQLTLLDSSNKRLLFLKELCNTLGLQALCIHKRAEEAGLDAKQRESYDIVVARAVAPLNILCEYCVPLLKMKGLFIAMKGPGGKEELEQAENAMEVLGVELADTHSITLPTAGERNVLVLQKRQFTPKAYPRHGGTIQKHPL